MFPIAIRTYSKISDEDFLYSTWMKSYRNASAVRAVPKLIYNAGQRNRINKILEHPETKVLIATSPDEESLIYGYVVLTGNVVHYVYVKSTYRKMGIAKALLEDIVNLPEISYTHKSSYLEIERLFKEDPQLLNWIYNPYLLELL